MRQLILSIRKYDPLVSARITLYPWGWNSSMQTCSWIDMLWRGIDGESPCENKINLRNRVSICPPESTTGSPPFENDHPAAKSTVFYRKRMPKLD